MHASATALRRPASGIRPEQLAPGIGLTHVGQGRISLHVTVVPREDNAAPAPAYSPHVGRWLSNDPIGISGGLNQYAAFGNNPVVFVDPEGERVVSVDTGQRRIVNNSPQVRMVDRTASRWHGRGHPGRLLPGTERWEDATGIFLTGFYRDDDGCWQLRDAADALAAARAYAASEFAQGSQTLENIHLGYLGTMGGIGLLGSLPPGLTVKAINLAAQHQSNILGVIRGSTLLGPVSMTGKAGVLEGTIRAGRLIYREIRGR